MRDIEDLRWELSIEAYSNELLQALGYSHPEPYREYLRATRERLKATRQWLADKLRGQHSDVDRSLIIRHKDEFITTVITLLSFTDGM